MISIIICDDDELFASQLKKDVEEAMQKREVSAKVHAFNSAEEIGSDIISNCDIAFLDIDFKGKDYNGIDIARKIRKAQNDAVIIFITNYIEYAPEGYEVQAFRYLFKSDIPRKLEAGIDKILEQIRAAKNDIKILSAGELIGIAVQDILYIEAMGHILHFHVTGKKSGEEREYTSYSTLAKMEIDLANRGFLRIHRSYLVNMMHVRKLNCNEAVFCSGDTLSVGSKNYAECKRAFMLWKGQH